MLIILFSSLLPKKLGFLFLKLFKWMVKWSLGFVCINCCETAFWVQNERLLKKKSYEDLLQKGVLVFKNVLLASPDRLIKQTLKLLQNVEFNHLTKMLSLTVAEWSCFWTLFVGFLKLYKLKCSLFYLPPFFARVLICCPCF